MALASLREAETLAGLHALPESTRLFYCAFCMYQPDDGVQGGLSITEQLALAPFAKIIRSPLCNHGMYIIHTRECEVYSRLWCVHEVDEAEALSRKLRFHVRRLRSINRGGRLPTHASCRSTRRWRLASR